MSDKPERTPKPEFDYLSWTAPPQTRTEGGRRKIGSLFVEQIVFAQWKKYPPLYTMQEQEQWDTVHGGWIPSAKKIYVNSNSEYEGAIRLLGSIEHWNLLLEKAWFVEGPQEGEPKMWEGLERWRQEQDLRKAGIAEAMLVKAAIGGNVMAAKILMEGGGKKRGRPTSKEKTPDYKNNAKVVDLRDHMELVMREESNG